MNLTTKIDLVLATTFSIALVVGGLVTYFMSENIARQHATEQAELILLEAIAVRAYGTGEDQARLNRVNGGRFHPQTVAALTETWRANPSRPTYSYREAFLGPTDPLARATVLEESIIDRFVASPQLDRLTGVEIVNGLETLYVSSPIRIASPECLTCHGNAENTSAALRAVYGGNSGFGWEMNEVIGTQLVAVPFPIPSDLTNRSVTSFIVFLASFFIVLFLVLRIMLRKLVLVPVSRVTRLATKLVQGNLQDTEIKVTGKDELADMTRAFNRLRRRMIKVVQLLRKQQARVKQLTADTDVLDCRPPIDSPDLDQGSQDQPAGDRLSGDNVN